MVGSLAPLGALIIFGSLMSLGTLYDRGPLTRLRHTPRSRLALSLRHHQGFRLRSTSTAHSRSTAALYRHGTHIKHGWWTGLELHQTSRPWRPPPVAPASRHPPVSRLALFFRHPHVKRLRSLDSAHSCHSAALCRYGTLYPYGCALFPRYPHGTGSLIRHGTLTNAAALICCGTLTEFGCAR